MSDPWPGTSPAGLYSGDTVPRSSPMVQRTKRLQPGAASLPWVTERNQPAACMAARIQPRPFPRPQRSRVPKPNLARDFQSGLRWESSPLKPQPQSGLRFSNDSKNYLPPTLLETDWPYSALNFSGIRTTISLFIKFSNFSSPVFG